MRMYVLFDQSPEPFHIDHKHLPETNKSHLKNDGWSPVGGWFSS